MSYISPSELRELAVKDKINYCCVGHEAILYRPYTECPACGIYAVKKERDALAARVKELEEQLAKEQNKVECPSCDYGLLASCTCKIHNKVNPPQHLKEKP